MRFEDSKRHRDFVLDSTLDALAGPTRSAINGLNPNNRLLRGETNLWLKVELQLNGKISHITLRPVIFRCSSTW